MKVYKETVRKYFKTIFEQATAGEYSVDLPAGDYLVELYGGGGGYGSYSWSGLNSFATRNSSGASGAGFKAIVTLAGGTYKLTIGDAGTNAQTGTDGGDTSLGNLIIAGGGAGGVGTQHEPSIGGAVTLNNTSIIKKVLSLLNGNNGSNKTAMNSWTTPDLDGGLSVYNNTTTGYGAGGGKPSEAVSGYCRIMGISNANDYEIKDETVTYKLPTKVDRTYYKYIDWTQPVLTSDTDKNCTVTCSASFSGYPAYKAMDGSKTDCWFPNAKTGWWQIKLPDKILITGLTHIAGNYNSQTQGITGRYYTSSSKTTPIGNEFSGTYAQGTVVNISNIPAEGILTDTIYFEKIGGSGTPENSGIGELIITAKQVLDGTESDHDNYEDKIIYYGIGG